MTTHRLVKFEEARKAADSYYRTVVNARDRQYDFLAHAYLAYREGQRHKTAYAKALELRLGREPTGVQKDRPFLCLINALLGSEERKAKNSLPQYSKLSGALEAIHDRFSAKTPHYHRILEYIKEQGGVTGLYELKCRTTRRAQQTDKQVTRLASRSALYELPDLGLEVRPSGAGCEVALPDCAPGTYLVRVHVGENGILKELRVESTADPIFKPVLKTA